MMCKIIAHENNEHEKEYMTIDYVIGFIRELKSLGYNVEYDLSILVDKDDAIIHIHSIKPQLKG